MYLVCFSQSYACTKPPRTHVTACRFSTDLREYQYDDKVGKDALVAAVEEIYKFVDSDLLALKSSMNNEISRMFDNAERKLKRVKKIVNGVRSASLAANTATAGTVFIPGVGLVVATGLGVANIIQQAATAPETEKRMKELNEAVLELTELDMESMTSIDEFNSALLSVTGNLESASVSVREGAKGFLMALTVARENGIAFTEFMDELVEEYIENSRNFDTKLKELQVMEAASVELDMRPFVNQWVGTSSTLSQTLQLTGLTYGLFLQRKVRIILNGDGVPAGRNALPVNSGLGDQVAKAQKLSNRIKGLTYFAAALSLVAVGLDITSLVKQNKEFNRIARELKGGRTAVLDEISDYVDDLEKTQDSFDLDVSATSAE